MDAWRGWTGVAAVDGLLGERFMQQVEVGNAEPAPALTSDD
jgi:hypothetical protein